MRYLILLLLIISLSGCASTSGAIPPEALLIAPARVPKGVMRKESDFQDYALRRFEREELLEANVNAAHSIAYPEK